MPTVSTPQRQISPLPPGRYWVDLVGPDMIRDFLAWVRDMDGAAVVESMQRQTLQRDPTAFFSAGTIELAFTLFHVPPGRAPFWPAHLGFPSFAPADIRQREDAIPPPAPEPVFALPDLPNVSAFGAGVGSGALALLALYLFLKLKP